MPVIFIYWEKAFPAAAKNIGGFWPSAFNYLLWNANELVPHLADLRGRGSGMSRLAPAPLRIEP